MRRGSGSLLYWLIGLLGIMVINGCDETDDTPAQFVSTVDNVGFLEVYFDKPPENLNVTGAIEYTLLYRTLQITAKCGTDIVLSWQGGQETFHYTCRDPSDATRVVEILPPPGAIPPNQWFALTLDQGVVAVTVNDTPAEGAWRNWTVEPGLTEGENVQLLIEWINRTGTTGEQEVGPYTVRAE